jgi:hypothetical protein
MAPNTRTNKKKEDPPCKKPSLSKKSSSAFGAISSPNFKKCQQNCTSPRSNPKNGPDLSNTIKITGYIINKPIDHNMGQGIILFFDGLFEQHFSSTIYKGARHPTYGPWLADHNIMQWVWQNCVNPKTGEPLKNSCNYTMKGFVKLADGTICCKLNDICNYIKNDLVPEIKEEWDEFAHYDFIIKHLSDGYVWSDIMSKHNTARLLTQHNRYAFHDIDPGEGSFPMWIKVGDNAHTIDAYWDDGEHLST